MILTAYTLGAGDARVLARVVLPHCLPGIIDVARVNLAAAWPMLVVAELLAAHRRPRATGSSVRSATARSTRSSPCSSCSR